MNYGIPYMGSKSKICKQICSAFPKAENFYDLLGGGFSITHYMIKNRGNDFGTFHFNEIRSGVCELIKDAIDGKYNYDVFKPKWISREEFHKEKGNNAYIKLLWSFGNNGINYLFSGENERLKKSIHNAIIFNEFDELAVKILGCDKFKDGYTVKDKRFFANSRMNDFQLEQLQRLEQLQQLERLEQLHFYSTSYENVSIKENSTIYCDIPYKGTGEYDKNALFDHDQFFEWAHNQQHSVYISEYRIDDKRFTPVMVLNKRSMFDSSKEKKMIKIERLYVNQYGLKQLKK